VPGQNVGLELRVLATERPNEFAGRLRIELEARPVRLPQ
jgi:hypothetical protein